MLQKVSEPIAYCYQHPSECRAKAGDAFNEAAKQEFFDMEHRWLMLARSYELSDRITDYTNEVASRLRVPIPSDPPHPAIPRVNCEQCGKRMRLASIASVAADGRPADGATFDCKCGFTYQVVIERSR
jgi:hypothetical protein